jgi:3-phosphoinositide dependent protein kinase-1
MMDNFENSNIIKIANGIENYEENTYSLKIDQKISSNIQSKNSRQNDSNKKTTIKDFEKISRLGKGSYAEVFHAKFRTSNKDVALKILDKNFMNELNKSHEALIEREILSSLDHHNIIKLLMTFHDKKKLYFVLEYAPNGDLASLTRSQGLFSFELARFYAAEIVNAIEYLQGKQIGHRDLKPENMILDTNWHIKIVKIN